MAAADLISSQQDFAGLQVANAASVANDVLNYVADVLAATSVPAPTIETVTASPMTGIAGNVTLTVPSVTTPSVSLPTPTLTVPSMPSVSLTGLSEFGASLPSVTMPTSTVPSASVPSASVPDTSIPSGAPFQNALGSVTTTTTNLDGSTTSTTAPVTPTLLAAGGGSNLTLSPVDIGTSDSVSALPAPGLQSSNSVGGAFVASIGSDFDTTYSTVSNEVVTALDTVVTDYLSLFVDGWSSTSSIINTLASDIVGGGSFLNEAAELAIYNRMNQRIDVESRANQRQVSRAARKRGFEMPQFALVAALNNAASADSDRRAIAATEAAVELLKMKVEILNTVLSVTGQIKQAVIGAFVQYAGLVLEARRVAQAVASGSSGAVATGANADISLLSTQNDYTAKQYASDISALQAAVGALDAKNRVLIAGIQASVDINRNEIAAAQLENDFIVRSDANQIQMATALANLAGESEGHAVQAQGIAVQAQGNAIRAQEVAVQAQKNAIDAQGNVVQLQGVSVSAMNAQSSAIGHLLSAGSAMQGHAVNSQGNMVQAEANAIRIAEATARLNVENKGIEVQGTQVSATMANALLDAKARTNIAIAEMDNRSKIAVAQITQGVAAAMGEIAKGAMNSISGVAYEGETTNN